MHNSPILYVIASPIGNLRDISQRALDILSSVSLLGAEDTRVARRLLAAHGIYGKRLLSLRAHNENHAAEALLAGAFELGTVAYLSDAGTPSISDPGARLVRAARAAGVRVSPVPGASALTALLSVAGVPESAVHFFGFPPRAAVRRRDFFEKLLLLSGSAVLFEAPTRMSDTVSQLLAVLDSNTRVVVGRELTKTHEQVVDISLENLEQALAEGSVPARGEFTLLVELPGRNPLAAVGDALFTALAAELPRRRAASLAAQFCGGDANDYYRRHIKK